MQATWTRSRFTPLLALALSLGVGACGSNPVGDDEEHPAALVLLNAQGQSVVTISEGTSGAAVTGRIEVALNGTQTYTVAAQSESGARLTLDGGELSVRIGAQPANAVVTLQGANQLVVAGRTAGTATVRLELMHGGHAELGGEVPVVVQ